MPTVVVSGAIANKHLNGGEAWVRLSWILGFRRLGCEVIFVEQLGADAGDEPRAYFDDVVEQFGLGGSAVLLRGDDESISGMSLDEAVEAAAGADLLVNISGHLQAPQLMRRLRRKAYVDLDPGFTQFWHLAGNTGARLEGHDLYFTVGENIGTDVCSIPTAGFDWRAVPPPVVLEEWPAAPGDGPFTTIGAWRGAFGPVVHDGHTYGLKVHEFRKMIDLPRRVPAAAFEIALDIHPGDNADREALEEHGWRLTDPHTEAPGPLEFRRFVQRAGAEFSVAQGIYVETCSGWFSDRTVRYLASGKPALVQDTGFSRNYPTGEGLVPFSSLEEAVAGAAGIASDHARHAAAARKLAEERFDSDKVLTRFLEQALD